MTVLKARDIPRGGWNGAGERVKKPLGWTGLAVTQEAALHAGVPKGKPSALGAAEAPESGWPAFSLECDRRD